MVLIVISLVSLRKVSPTNFVNFFGFSYPYAKAYRHKRASFGVYGLERLQATPRTYREKNKSLRMLHEISPCTTNASTPTGVNAFFKLIFKELTPAGYAPRSAIIYE